MEKKITEIVFILDRSGSMEGLTEDTIGGFNSLIKEHKEDDGTVLISTVLFNQFSELIHDRIDIKDVPKMTRKDYKAFGSTALIDALGETITNIDMIQKHLRKEDVPQKTLFVITTDGMENSSVKYTSDEVKKMVKKKTKKGWDFIFLAANIDAVETAKNYGIDERFAANYVADKEGMQKRRDVTSRVMEMAICGGVITEDWKDGLEDK